MTINEIEALVRRGAASLTESLGCYWPSCGKNDVPEVNISLHVGAVLAANGFLTYADVHDFDKANIRLDLLGLHRAKQTLVLAEFKRLWNPKSARAMANDLARLRAWRLADSRVHPDVRVAHRYAVLAATTWNKRYIDWFTDSSKRSVDPSRGGLTRIAEGIPGDEARWGSILILRDAPVEKRGPTDEWLVYVVFPLA